MSSENIPEVEKVELEQQFILRLPQPEADKIRTFLRSKPEKLKKNFKIDLNLDENSAEVFVEKRKLYGRLKKFPTTIESNKTHFKKHLFKTADVSQILICDYEKQENAQVELQHGYAPPLKNVKKRRFRKTLINTEQAIEVENIEKELYYLLRTDFEAVSSKFEIFYENVGENKENCPENRNKETILFGNMSSESDSNEEV